MPNHTKTSYKMKWRLQSHNALHSAINLCCRSKLELIWKHKCVTNRRLPVCGPPSHPILPGFVMRLMLPSSWSWRTRDCQCAPSAERQMTTSVRGVTVVWRTQTAASPDGVQMRRLQLYWYSHPQVPLSLWRPVQINHAVVCMWNTYHSHQIKHTAPRK